MTTIAELWLSRDFHDSPDPISGCVLWVNEPKFDGYGYFSIGDAGWLHVPALNAIPPGTCVKVRLVYDE